jgi:hypothetical protein
LARWNWSMTAVSSTSRAGDQRTLLAILLVHANEVVSTDRLIVGLWGAVAGLGGEGDAARRLAGAPLARRRLVTRAPGC